MAVHVQLRRDSSSNWTSVNPVLAEGELGVELDSFRAKLGNGISSYNDLPYAIDFDSRAVTKISAGTQSCNQQLIFSNSNGVSFGISASTLTASIVAGGGALTNVNVSAGTTSNNLSNLVFSNSNNVSFGLDGSTITASASGGGGGSVSFSAGTTSSNLASVTFSNSNGITFGLGTGASAGVITASHNALTSQSNQAFSADASSTFQTLSFQNSNGVSFSNNAGALRVTHDLQFTSATSAITSNALNTSVSRVINIVAATNNTGGGTASLSSNVSFSNANGVTFYTSAGGAVAASYTVPSVTNSSWTVSDAATSATVGRLAFTNSNGLTLSLSTSNNGNHTVIGSYTVPTVTNSSLTLSDAATSMTIGRLAFTNSNGLTLSLSTAAGGSATLLGSYTVPTVTNSSWTVSDNATSATVGRLAFTQSNGITMSLSTSNNGNHTVIASYTVPTVTNSSMTVSDAATSGTLARLAFTNLNGVTLSLSTGAGGSHTIIGSHNALTSQSNQAFSAGGGSSAFQTLNFANSFGISFSNSNGSVAASVATSLTNINMSAGTASTNASAFTFSNSNNFTFGLGTGASAGVITASFSESVQTLGLYAVSNTEGASSSSTFDARTVSFQGKGAVSVGFSNGSVVIDAPSAAAGNVTFSAGAASAGLASIVFSNSNGVSFGLNGSTITASAAGGGVGGGVSTFGNTAGSTGTVTTGNIIFVGTGPISLSQSTGAAGSAATISINGPATSSLVGASGLSVSTNGSTISVYDAATCGWLEPYPMTNTAFIAAGAGSWYFAPFIAPANMSGGRINLLFSNTSTAGIVRDITGASYVSSSSGGKNQSFSYSNVVALYSQGTGSNSTRLESFWSNSFSFGLSHKLSVSQSGGASSIQISVSQSISYISEIGSDGAYTLNQFSSSANSNVAGTSTASNQFDSVGLSIRNMLSDQLIQPIGFNTTITAGAYWLANWWSSTRSTQTSGTSFAGASALDFSQKSQLGISRLLLEASFRNWASTATTARSHIMPYGVYTAISAVPPQFVALSSDLSSLGSAWVPYFNFQLQGITK